MRAPAPSLPLVVMVHCVQFLLVALRKSFLYRSQVSELVTGKGDRGRGDKPA